MHMKKTYQTKADAKINLFLRCCGKYPNGYHRLYMLMQQIDLGDDITVELDDGRGFDIEIESGVGIPREKDLGYKADKAFYDALELKLGEEASKSFPYTFIKQVKDVPSQAGLGGGSSDAASVLKVLQEHFNNPLTEQELLSISAKLGADVPFFLYGGTCICEGVGEIVTKLPSVTGMPLILVKPDVGVGTKECYELSDESNVSFDEEGYKELMSSFFEDEGRSPAERIAAAAASLTNDLQDPAIKIAPVIRDLIGAIERTGPLYCAMTGSGSCVFGIYENESLRDGALAVLKNDPLVSGCKLIPSVMV